MISVSSAQMDAWLAAFAWPLVRILALVGSAPVIGNPSVPMRLKIALSLLLTFLVAPLLPPGPNVAPASAEGLLILAQQILIGLAMGLAMHIVLHAVEFAGEIIGLQMGLGFATLYDASVPGMIPIIGQFMGVIVSLAFLAVHGHVLVLAAVVESFQVLPFAPVSAASGLQALVSWAGNIFVFGLALALPVLAALLISNIALGVLTSVAPQLNIFAVGFPLTILVGLAALALALPYFAPNFERMFMEGLQAMLRVASALQAR